MTTCGRAVTCGQSWGRIEVFQLLSSSGGSKTKGGLHLGPFWFCAQRCLRFGVPLAACTYRGMPSTKPISHQVRSWAAADGEAEKQLWRKAAGCCFIHLLITKQETRGRAARWVRDPPFGGGAGAPDAISPVGCWPRAPNEGPGEGRRLAGQAPGPFLGV